MAYADKMENVFVKKDSLEMIVVKLCVLKIVTIKEYAILLMVIYKKMHKCNIFYQDIVSQFL
jgi:hypothetical protein